MDPVELFLLVFAVSFGLVFTGVLLIMFSLIKEMRKSTKESKADVGGVVIIGPLPIVFGTSTKIAKVMLILAIVLVSLLILLHLLFWAF